MKYTYSVTDEEENIDGTIEFDLNDEQIELLIKKLRTLQEKKNSIRMEIDNITETIIKYKKSRK